MGIIGNSFHNDLSGMRGHDYLRGEAGHDDLLGGAGNDILNGSDDYYSGSGEEDKLTGGAGADIFVLGDYFKAYYQGSGYATITDFEYGEDKIHVFGSASNYSFSHSDWLGDSSRDTSIYYNGDRIAVLQDAYTSETYIDTDFIFV